MALVTCPECSTQVPDKAAACPECGCPLVSALSPAVAAPIPYAPPGYPAQPPYGSALHAPASPPVPLPPAASPPTQQPAQQPGLSQPKTGVSGLVIALVVIGAVVGAFVLVGVFGDPYAVSDTAPHRFDEHTVAVTAVTPPARPNDGTDAHRPVLADADLGFVDTRGGWGWGDKCWTHLKAGMWGWAKAECDQGMAMNPASPQPRASLLYNEGLVAKAAGNIDQARGDFTASLVLRENAEVRSALNGL